MIVLALLDSDAGFFVAIALAVLVVAVVAAAVVLAGYRRANALPPSVPPPEAPEAPAAPREPVFFKRYTPDENSRG